MGVRIFTPPFPLHFASTAHERRRTQGGGFGDNTLGFLRFLGISADAPGIGGGGQGWSA